MFSKNDFVRLRGAQKNNLRDVDLDFPRNSIVLFTGVSGSGKSSLAFGTIYAEAQKRYFDSIAPYARRLIAQLPAAKLHSLEGLPPAVALQQRRSEAQSRSSVGTITNISNSLRMLFSRFGQYPQELVKTGIRLDSDSFSPNTPAGACTSCHGTGLVWDITEDSLVPDPSLSIKERAIAAWPGAWQGKNYRDILATLGYDIEKPWKDLPESDRHWILFTEETPVVTVHAEREAHRIQRPYKGTYMSAAKYVRHTFSTTASSTLRKKAARFMVASTCSLCQGRRLKAESLSVLFCGHDIAELGSMPLSRLKEILVNASKPGKQADDLASISLITELVERISHLENLGLEYLSLDRPTTTLSSGELQRLRISTLLKAGLFGVVYILDEPSAGLHPKDTESVIAAIKQLQASGNSIIVVEHELDIVREADWIVDIGPGAGDYGGNILFSGTMDDFMNTAREDKNFQSHTARYLWPDNSRTAIDALPAANTENSANLLSFNGINKHNLRNIDVSIPLGTFTVISGVSGAGKTTLLNKIMLGALDELLTGNCPQTSSSDDFGSDADAEEYNGEIENLIAHDEKVLGRYLDSVTGYDSIRRVISVDQKPIGRTPRSNLATYTGVFDRIRKSFAATADARSRKYKPGRFSFNVQGGRCEHCQGEGFTSIELMFLPSVYTSCQVCKGSRYNDETLEIELNGKNIAQVLDMTVDSAKSFFSGDPAIAKTLQTLESIGLGYLRLGQPATELSGGEAQRVKLASELQRTQKGDAIYLLDEPSTGLHPEDVNRLLHLLFALVGSGNTVIVVEHDLEIISRAQWVIDLGPGAGDNGGRVVASGPPEMIARTKASPTGAYLFRRLAGIQTDRS